MRKNQLEKNLLTISQKSGDLVTTINSFNVDSPWDDQVNKYKTALMYLQTLQKKQEKQKPKTRKEKQQPSGPGEIAEFFNFKVSMSNVPVERVNWYQDSLSVFTTDLQDNETQPVEVSKDHDKNCEYTIKKWKFLTKDLKKETNEVNVEPTVDENLLDHIIPVQPPSHREIKLNINTEFDSKAKVVNIKHPKITKIEQRRREIRPKTLLSPKDEDEKVIVPSKRKITEIQIIPGSVIGQQEKKIKIEGIEFTTKLKHLA